MGWAKQSGKEMHNRLYLTRVYPLELAKWKLVFEEPMLAGTKIWNACVWESSEAKKRGKPYPSESEMKALLKNHPRWKDNFSQTSQAIVEEYFEAVRSYQTHKKNGHSEMNPPGSKPKHILRTLTWKKQGFIYDGKRLMLKQARGRSPITIPLPVDAGVLTLYDGTILHGEPVEVKVKAVYRQRRLTGFELHVGWDFGVVDVKPSKTRVSAYDINTALIARSTTEGSRQLIVCREIFALVQYRNKIQAEFQSRMDTIKERSRLWKALNRAKAKRLRKLDRRIDHMMHTLTKMMAELDRSERINVSLLGDLKDLRRTARKGDKNPKASQKINQLPTAKLKSLHHYKSLMRKVQPGVVSEQNSSQTCSQCGEKKKAYRVHRGLWHCQGCGARLHADLNGSDNMLKNHLYGSCVEEKRAIPWQGSPAVYHWDRRYNCFREVSLRATA